MKRIVLTLPFVVNVLYVLLIASTAILNNRTPNGFYTTGNKSGIIPKPYENISLQDSDVVRKIHELDCYFEDKVKIGFNKAVLINYKGTLAFFERYYGYKNFATKAPLTLHSTFPDCFHIKNVYIGSYFTIVTAKYAFSGRYDSEVFPNFPIKVLPSACYSTTVRGLPNYLNFSEQYWKNKSIYD